MIRFIFLLLIAASTFHHSPSQDWADIPVPADPGEGLIWELKDSLSDDFNYTYAESSQKNNFGNNRWYNFYHNSWDGPGTTYWQYDHVSVDGSDLVLRTSRNPSTSKMGVPGVNAACITSNNKVQYPVFIEASASVANITLASDVWLLSPDDTQEIDMIECYGGAQNGNSWFAKFIHLSHHSFIRDPFQDYQPRDMNSWWEKSGVSSWGVYCWNGGDRKYVRMGMHWLSPYHFEYYVDGDLVRVLYEKAFATKKGNTWYYTYPTMTDGLLDMENGYQKVVQYATNSEFDFQLLMEASNTSTTSVIDPYNYQGENGFTKELDIIINMESQDWHVAAGRTPTDEELSDSSKNTMKVDWIRVYKPAEPSFINSISPENKSRIKVFPNPLKNDDITIDFGKYAEKIDIDILDLSGRILKEFSDNGQQIVVNRYIFPGPGTYLIRISDQELIETKKVLVF